MKVMAHRGYSGVYPENTMLSFREAVKVGCDAIEMDVHETRDGRLVVIHDERLDRTTDGTGRICDHTFDELRQAGWDAVDVVFGAKSSDSEKWPNLRHELWWQLRDRFHDGRIAPVAGSTPSADGPVASGFVAMKRAPSLMSG